MQIHTIAHGVGEDGLLETAKGALPDEMMRRVKIRGLEHLHGLVAEGTRTASVDEAMLGELVIYFNLRLLEN